MKRSALLAGAVVLAALAACSTQAQLAGAGAECYQASDCQEGLICIPQKDGSSICSSDLSMVQTVEDAAAGDAATKPDVGAEAGGDGASPPQDSGTQPDTASAPDTASPTPDSSSPDTSSPTPDSSTPDTSSPDDAPSE